MRLTLRTLLAYLDDVLEAEQAKELGEKIQQTPYAQNLINRIRDVLRRRRLLAPDVSGPSGGLDPNAIAEYLDNTLAPDEVADVEKVCLESDVHLAEVAACHQILAAVLGEPVEVPRSTRERMYALAPPSSGGVETPATGTAKQPPGEGSRSAAPAVHEAPASPRRAADVPPPERSSIHDRLPEFLKRPRLAQRMLPYAVIALIAAFWFGLLWMDPTFLGRPDTPAQKPPGPSSVAQSGAVGTDGGANTGGSADGVAAPHVATDTREGSEIVAQSATSADRAADVAATLEPPDRKGGPAAERPEGPGTQASQPAATGETGLPEVPVASAATPAVRPAETPPLTAGDAKMTGTVGNTPQRLFPPEGTDATPTAPQPSDGGAKPTAAGPAPGGSQSAADSAASPAGTVQPGKPSPDTDKADRTLARVETPTPPVVPPVAPEAVLPVEYSSTEGILLRFDPDRGGWFVLPRRALVRPGEEIACPAPFEAELVVGRRQLIVRLDGGTRLRLERCSTQGGLQVDLVRGRLVLTGQSGALPQPAVSGPLPPLGVPQTAPATGRTIPCTVRIGPSVFRLTLETDDALCGVEVRPPQPRGFEDRSAAGRFDGGIFVVRGAVDVSAGETMAKLKAPTWVPLSPELGRGDGPLPTSQLLSVPDWLAPDDQRNTAIRRRYATLFEKEFDPSLPAENVLPTVVLTPPPGISQLAAECLGLIEHVPGLVKALALSEYGEAREVAVRELRIWLLRHEDAGQKLRAALAAHFSAEDVETVYQLLWGYPPESATDPQTSKLLVSLLEHDQLAVRYLAFYNIYMLTGRKNDYRPDAPLAQRLAGVKRWKLHLERFGALVKPDVRPE